MLIVMKTGVPVKTPANLKSLATFSHASFQDQTGVGMIASANRTSLILNVSSGNEPIANVEIEGGGGGS